MRNLSTYQNLPPRYMTTMLKYPHVHVTVSQNRNKTPWMSPSVTAPLYWKNLSHQQHPSHKPHSSPFQKVIYHKASQVPLWPQLKQPPRWQPPPWQLSHHNTPSLHMNWKNSSTLPWENEEEELEETHQVHQEEEALPKPEQQHNQ